MANNRLYLANRRTRQYTLLTKGYADGWFKLDTDDIPTLNFFLESDSRSCAEIEPTDLFLTTEQDAVDLEAEGYEYVRIALNDGAPAVK